MVVALNASPTLDHCTLSNGSYAGVYVQGSYTGETSSSIPHINSCKIQNNSIGIDIATSLPTLFNCSIEGNSNLGLRNNGAKTVIAENNWWGHATGPNHPNNPNGQGQPIEGNVDFDPWLIAPPGEPVAKPIITNLSPSSGPIGTLVTITGENFGGSQGDSTVTINGFDQGTADSWSDTAISITVKEGTTTGPVVVTVNGQASNNDKIFTVTVIVCIKGDVNGDEQVKSNDAILCLKIAAGILIPDDRQRCAADMNCDGQIKSNDAILILKKAAGIPVPPCSIITVNQTDVTPRFVSFKGISYKNGVITLAIVVNNFDDVAGADISLAYNPSGLSPIEVTSPQGTTLVANLNTSGKIKIAWVKLEDVEIDAIAMLSFKVIDLKHASLSLESAQLYNSDALPIPTKILQRNLEALIIPKDNQILANYPNPFNPDTWIPYQLAKESDVTIRIYNLSGQLVRALELGYKDAGLYYSRERAAHWDGRNTTGEQVASGVYFYHIKAGDFQATRKLLMTK
jgi:hypothetical protein